MTDIKYSFKEIKECNFCKSGTQSNKVLGLRLNKTQGYRPGSETGIAVSILQCSNCGLIYSNPLPIPFSIQDHYGIPPEDYWVDRYFEINENYYSHEINTAKKLLGFKPGMKSLDIGAGLGKGMIVLKKAGFDAYGIEPSIPFRERAISKMGIDPDRMQPKMIEEADYQENFFDWITFGAVVEHLYDPAGSIEKALKWAKPGGLIHIEVPSSNWLLPKLYDFYYKIIGTTFTTHLSPMHEPYHLHEFSLVSFKKLAEALNFEIAHHEYYVCDIYRIPKFMHPLLRWYMKKTNKGMQLAIWLRKK